VGKSAPEIIEEDANGNLLCAGAEKVGAACSYIVIVEDEDLNVDGLPGGREFLLEGTEEGRPAEVVGEFSVDWSADAKFVEVRLECG